ncbi:FecR family protein [Prevotella sp. KH2C16]|uniref:FecR family protein n=1 Tax=Prevotella sp. KH2C16 TaxID=1855325 RepID=UPI0008ED0F1C|nr:FecR domain-containing protein [Prevotella sp. KH2C16]SFG25710.1 protein of unknown function [Prevotella sp. KH2C16]
MMNENITNHIYDKTLEDRIIKDFVIKSMPMEIEIGSIKKKTYIKIYNEKKRLKYRRMVLAVLGAAASLLLLVTVTMHLVKSSDDTASQTASYTLDKKIQQVSLHVPIGDKMTIMLSDGTKLIANSNSIVKYPKVFSGKTRDVFAKGEVYFEVAHDKAHPFIVHSEGFNLRVLGTRFALCNYNEKKSNVVLVQGSVEITTKNRDKVRMRPNQLADIIDGNISGLSGIDVSEYISWLDGVMELHGDNLQMVVERLNNYYGTDIKVKGSCHSKLYGKLVYQKSVDDVVGVINQITGTHTHISNGTVQISE